MENIMLSLVFSMPLLLIMFYPSIKIVEYIQTKRELSKRTYISLTLLITLLLSIIAGVILSFF